jgi:hypothetical protein
MKQIKLSDKFSRSFNKGLMKVKKHSPEILVVTGTIGLVVSGVMACKATTKADAVLNKAKKSISDIHEVASKVEAGEISVEEYTPEDQKKDLAIVYAKTGLDFVKLYGPSVALAALSVTGIFAGHNILRKRNLALAAAYMAEHTAFKEYSGRVVERFGKELDRELRYNIKSKEVEEVVVNEDGTQQTVKKVVEVGNPSDHSPYAKCFDETCSGWVRNAEENLFFIKQTQAYLNDLLQRRGHVFLNEAYDRLGFERTKAGQVVGWVYDEECPIGDNYIDFGIFNLHDENKRAFVNGYEKSIWLDFNVDGPIHELLP